MSMDSYFNSQIYPLNFNILFLKNNSKVEEPLTINDMSCRDVLTEVRLWRIGPTLC